MIVIADGGSTKCDWAVVDATKGEIIERFKTEGINPFAVSIEKIGEVLHTHFAPVAAKYDISNIFFYGSGCVFATVEKVKTLLAEIVPSADIFVGTDLDGAVNACCPDGNGIACIIGTGSASAQHEGGIRTKQVPALGYLLGDEGSGAVMGKKLLADVLKGLFPEDLTKLFYEDYPYEYIDFINNVYNKPRPQPNRFMASMTRFLSKHIDRPECVKIVEQSFTEFVERNILQYEQAKECPISFVGSIAYYFRPQLEKVLNNYGLKIGNISQVPMDGLVEYHKNAK